MLDRAVIIDFSKKSGRIKPLCGVCLGPLFDTAAPVDFTDEYRALGTPVARTAKWDMPEGCCRYLNVSSIFPDPALDERFPESYRFAEADKYMAAIKASGADIYLSLGERHDGYAIKPTRPHVPAEKWARIAEKIILHYNRGWGNGYKYSVKHVEIWPGADKCGAFADNPEEYYELYRVVANHLKSVFPTLRIGGYSSGGFRSQNRYDATDTERGYVDFLEGFLAYISDKTTHAPLDFLSWECRAESGEELSLHSNYARNFLLQYGFKRALSIVSELKLDLPSGQPRLSRDYPARLAAALIVASDANIDMMFYSDLHPYSPDNAVLTVDDCLTPHRYGAFGVMSAYGRLYSCGTRVDTTDNYRREVYALAAASDTEGAILIATGSYSGTLAITLSGAPYRTYSISGMLGGGKRGAGYSTSEENVPLGAGTIRLKVGRGEIYLITLS